jgi:integrase
VWPILPGFGRVGPWSTGLKSKTLAIAVERWLKEIAITDPAVVRGITAGHYSLREAYVAAKERRLEQLKERSSDPPLRDVIARYRTTVRDRRLMDGLRHLESAAPQGARLSWLMVPKHISNLLADAAAAGQKINSVHRSLYAAIKGMLVYEVGKARKTAITTDVVFRHEDDSRDVNVTPEQLERLLAACDDALRPIVALAMLTGIDRGPLARLTPAHLDLDAGTIQVPDTKSESRPRALQLSAASLSILRVQAAGRAQDAPLFDLDYDQVGNRFEVARRAAGLPGLRMKDLRHVFAGAWVASGGTLKDLGGALGHSRASTTLRYTGRQAGEDRKRMDTVAAQLGLDRAHLRVEKSQGGA